MYLAALMSPCCVLIRSAGRCCVLPPESTGKLSRRVLKIPEVLPPDFKSFASDFRNFAADPRNLAEIPETLSQLRCHGSQRPLFQISEALPQLPEALSWIAAALLSMRSVTNHGALPLTGYGSHQEAYGGSCVDTREVDGFSQGYRFPVT